MFVRNPMLKLALALGLIAVVALPGEAKPEPAHAAIATPVASHAAAQATYGLFLDPHVEPVLHIELPRGPFGSEAIAGAEPLP